MPIDSRGGSVGGSGNGAVNPRPPAPGPEPAKWINPAMPGVGTNDAWDAWKRKKDAYDNWKPTPTQGGGKTPIVTTPPLNRGGQQVVSGNTPGLIGGGNGSGGTSKPKKPAAKPNIPGPRVQKGKDVKVATKDLFLTEDKSIGPDFAAQKIFQEIGGIELLSIARNYSIDGSTQTYNPIANIANLSDEYSPFNIIPLQGIDKEYFIQYDIGLGNDIPDFPANPDGSRYNVYIDSLNNIVIDLVNLNANERVDVEFLTTEDLVGWYN